MMARVLPVFIFMLALVGVAQAQSPARDKVDDLKERIATKVAELRQTQKRAIAGSVTETSVSTISVETPTKEVKIELTDDILVYQVIRGKRTKLAIDDVDRGDFVVVFGDHDATLDILAAKLIFIQAIPRERIAGIVTSVDEKAFTFTALAGGNRKVVVDFEKASILNVWSKEGGIAKAGFSKIAVGDSIHVLGTPVPKKENRMSAIRILDLGNLTSK